MKNEPLNRLRAIITVNYIDREHPHIWGVISGHGMPPERSSIHRWRKGEIGMKATTVKLLSQRANDPEIIRIHKVGGSGLAQSLSPKNDEAMQILRSVLGDQAWLLCPHEMVEIVFKLDMDPLQKLGLVTNLFARINYPMRMLMGGNFWMEELSESKNTLLFSKCLNDALDDLDQLGVDLDDFSSIARDQLLYDDPYFARRNHADEATYEREVREGFEEGYRQMATEAYESCVSMTAFLPYIDEHAQTEGS